MLPLIPLLAVSTALQNLPPYLANVHKIVFMGDSITAAGTSPKGYITVIGQTLKTAYPNHPFELIGVGIGGQKAPDMHARFKKDVIDQHPDLVTISVGVNDVWHDFRDPAWTHRVPTGDSGRGVKLDLHLKELQAMVTEAKDAGIKVMILSPTVIYEDINCDENKRLNGYVDAQRKLAKENHVAFVELNKEFKVVLSAYQKEAGPSQLLLTVDGVHMNDQGNALMANSVLRAMGVPIPNHIKP
ncbi:MAG: lipolytic protein G-D-S-L family [Armatimonadetes bacterium]|nr:lipolytic protein G-D-S-L family [Armatimonadota bacterium]